MANRFRLAIAAQNVELKAFARHFEHLGDEDEARRGAVLFVLATLSFPDSGWQVAMVPVEGTGQEEWMLLEDPPGFEDGNRTYLVASGCTEKAVDAVPKTIRVSHGADVSRVSVVPWG